MRQDWKAIKNKVELNKGESNLQKISTLGENEKDKIAEEVFPYTENRF